VTDLKHHVKGQDVLTNSFTGSKTGDNFEVTGFRSVEIRISF